MQKKIYAISQLLGRKHQNPVMLYTFWENVPLLNIKTPNPLSYLKVS